MASIMLSAASRPPLAKNARMGHPRSDMGKERLWKGWATRPVNGVKMTPAQFSNYMAGFQAAAYDAKYKTGQLAEDAAEDMAVSYHPKGPYPFGLPWVYRGEQYGQWFGSWGGCR